MGAASDCWLTCKAAGSASFSNRARPCPASRQKACLSRPHLLCRPTQGERQDVKALSVPLEGPFRGALLVTTA